MIKNINIEKIQYYLVLLFTISLPYYITDAFIGTCSILIFIISLFIRKREIKDIFYQKHIISLIVFISITYLSMFWGYDEILSESTKAAFERYKYFPFIIIGIYLSNFTIEQLKKLLFYLVLSPIIYVITYYTNAFGLTLIYSDHYNIYVELVNLNNVFYTNHLMWDFKANVFILISVIYFYIHFLDNLRNKEARKSLIYLFFTLVYFISLFIDKVTDSRLMDIVGVVVISIISYKYIQHKYKLLILSTIVVVFSILIYMVQKQSFDKGFYQLNQALVYQNYEGSWGFRVGMIDAGYEILKDNPFLGIGINSTKKAVANIRKERPELLQTHPNIVSFHNEHVLILCEVGIVGYLIFLIFNFFYIKLKFRDNNLNIFKNSIVLMFLFLMVADYFIGNKSLGNMYALLIAIFTLYSRLEKEELV